MRGSAGGSPEPPPLKVLHTRLVAHFDGLSAERQAVQPDAPVFALEHGLSESELLLLATAVRASVRKGRLDRESWLPLVVYAAEIGYSYSGDEYWQTFESNTPGWEYLDRRPYLRERFKEFSRRFNGAEPGGAWAAHFTIICWPITHAILPTDLQRQLARLLFDYRRSLTTDQLATPDELGLRLAARSWHMSSRFQIFAENASLLGRVAASLLLGEGEHTSLLLDSTLARIVEDLTSERQAKSWLTGAQDAAARVRARGFRPIRKPGASRGDRDTRSGLASVADPSVVLRREDRGWTAFLEMPDFSVLAERLPEVADGLLRRRAIVEGAAGAPLARGRLLHPGQLVRLGSWPTTSRPLVQLEGGSTIANSLLADQSLMTSGPTWLFRVRDVGLAREVRGKFVRPGQEYVLLTSSEPSTSLPPWVQRALSTIDEMTALAIVVPQPLSPMDLQVLEELGAGVVTEIEVRPAGIVPAQWDGEGRAEWLTGEEPILGISSERAVEHCIVTYDGTPELINWPEGSRELFLRFAEPPAGRHEVHVALLLAGDAPRPAERSFEIVIRPPHTRPLAGTMREGLMLLATPINPTLPEIWDGTASVEIRGPLGASVDLRFALIDRDGKTLAVQRMRVALPVDSGRWQQLMSSSVRTNPSAVAAYDQVDRATVAASHPGLGSVSLDAERPFTPLRWAVRRDGREIVLRLIDNSGLDAVTVTQCSFERPDRVTAVRLDAPDLRITGGGLIVAKGGALSAGVIVPRMTVRRLADFGLRITLEPRERAADSVLDLLARSHDWWAASPPAEAVANVWRQQVLRELRHALTVLIAGDRWGRLEVESSSNAWTPLIDGVGKAPNHRALANVIVLDARELGTNDFDPAVHILATALERYGPRSCVHGHDVALAAFLLRLAGDPGTLLASFTADELTAYVRLLLETPLLLKAARLLVLLIESTAGPLEMA